MISPMVGIVLDCQKTAQHRHPSRRFRCCRPSEIPDVKLHGVATHASNQSGQQARGFVRVLKRSAGAAWARPACGHRLHAPHGRWRKEHASRSQEQQPGNFDGRPSSRSPCRYRWSSAPGPGQAPPLSRGRVAISGGRQPAQSPRVWSSLIKRMPSWLISSSSILLPEEVGRHVSEPNDDDQQRTHEFRIHPHASTAHPGNRRWPRQASSTSNTSSQNLLLHDEGHHRMPLAVVRWRPPSTRSPG